VPASGETVDFDGGFVSAAWVALRRTRLAAIRTHLKQQRAELQREFQRLHAEQARFEHERLNFQAECEKTAARTQLPAAHNKASDQNGAGDNVADYMQELLKRMRAERPGDYSAQSSGSEGEGDRTSATGDPAGDSESQQQSRKTRRAHNVNEVRAGVGTLREIANFSARAAVATHSSRKLRRSVATTLPLAVISFVLAAALLLLGGNGTRFYGQAFGTLMLGLIVAIEMSHSLWRIRRLERARTPAAKPAPAEAVKEEPVAEENSSPAPNPD
jgi:hypothetical protein